MTTHKNSRKHSKKMKGGDSSLYSNYNYINTPKKENESWLPDFSGFTDKFSGLSDSVTNLFKNNNSNNYNYTPQTGGKQMRSNKSKSKRNHKRKTYKRR